MKKLFLFAFLLVLTSSCFKKYDAKITIDGSSSVYPITEAVAEEFREVEPDIRVTVGVSGTGGGFRKFTRGETDISNASRPITAIEIKAAQENGIEFIEIPVAYDGLAVVVSTENDFVDYLTISELKKIWEPEAQGVIKSWKQVRESFPDVPLNLYGAGTSSGTYDYFTEAVVGKAKSSRGDYTASEDDNVLVQGVSTDKGGLGYFGLAYYSENAGKLKLVPIDDENPENGTAPVLPSAASVNDGSYGPLARPEFIYVSLKAANDPYVQKFIKFYMENAPVLVEEVGYIPLSKEAYQIAYERFLKKIPGSMFDDKSHVGVDLIKILRSENE